MPDAPFGSVIPKQCCVYCFLSNHIGIVEGQCLDNRTRQSWIIKCSLSSPVYSPIPTTTSAPGSIEKASPIPHPATEWHPNEFAGGLFLCHFLILDCTFISCFHMSIENKMHLSHYTLHFWDHKSSWITVSLGSVFCQNYCLFFMAQKTILFANTWASMSK